MKAPILAFYISIEKHQNDKNTAGKIVEVGMSINKPVVATGNVYYLEKEDKLYSNILSSAYNENITDNTKLNHFRTTDEMLKNMRSKHNGTKR